jgi:Asp/Glu/hydantoin racemase
MTELQALPAYDRALRDHLAVAGGSNVIDVFGVSLGTYRGRPPMATLHYPYGMYTALAPILDNVVLAEKSGYDAFVMGSFVAPLFREARCAVDIPVTSMAESALLVAWSLARRVALVCISAEQADTTSDTIDQLGLSTRVAATVSLDEPVGENRVSEALRGDSTTLVASFERAARSALTSGADLVIPAEGILSEVVRRAGVTAVDGAPVLDAVDVAIEHTVMLAALQQSGSARTARLRSFPKLPE